MLPHEFELLYRLKSRSDVRGFRDSGDVSYTSVIPDVINHGELCQVFITNAIEKWHQRLHSAVNFGDTLTHALVVTKFVTAQ